MAGPLHGIRVLDLTRVLAGPWCTQILGDLGADVIKIEHPERGDDTRRWGPPWLRDRDGNETADAAYFFSANRNKRSVTVNIKSGKGARILRDLVAESDLLIENFKVGSLEKLGLGYDALSALHPGLIYVSITGFGQTGPLAAQPGYDYLIQGLGGLMSITGLPDDAPGGGPQRVGVPIVDINAGLFAAIGVLSALHHRNQTGEGQHIDLALLDSQVGWLMNQAMNYLIGAQVPGRTGNEHPNLVPYQPFRTRDGDIIIAVGNDHQFARLCHGIGLPHLSADARYETNGNRIKNRTQLIEIISNEVRKHSNAHWLSELPAIGVPCSVINDIEQVFSHPQVRARDMRIDLDHPVAGRVPGVANPLKFSRSGIEYRKAPPVHGADTADVLGSLLMYSEEQIDQLRQEQVI
ncbi:MAG: CaiB/BaiF CoA-transferase family protein [Gammaproteobacteria bacterium]|nr:CaiB/BaiF CoA-transferase family protein [Gammaproteobacteria bacterium]